MSRTQLRTQVRVSVTCRKRGGGVYARGKLQGQQHDFFTPLDVHRERIRLTPAGASKEMGGSNALRAFYRLSVHNSKKKLKSATGRD